MNFNPKLLPGIASFLHALCAVAGCIYVATVQKNVYLGCHEIHLRP